MKLMLRSYSNLLLSVRRVTEINQGKNTPGIDGFFVKTPEDRCKLVKNWDYQLWKIKPTKRIYIPKANGKSRPLGISTTSDRIAQSIIKNALEPSWEARFEINSYGFRPGRSCHGVSKETFAYFDHRLVKMLIKWAKRRHPSKGIEWAIPRYFGRIKGDKWVFKAISENRHGEKITKYIFRLATIPIVRHISHIWQLRSTLGTSHQKVGH